MKITLDIPDNATNKEVIKAVWTQLFPHFKETYTDVPKYFFGMHSTDKNFIDMEMTDRSDWLTKKYKNTNKK